MFINGKSSEINHLPASFNGKDQINHKSTDKKSNKHSSTFFAGNSNLILDPIAEKKMMGQKNAMKKILDQHKNELKTDDIVTELNEKKKALAKQAEQATNELKRLDALKHDLKASFGITEDSAEQKDLELLEKSIFEPEKITDEEYNKLKNMGPLTDYQKEALQYDSMEKIWKQRVDNAGNGISGINGSLIGISLAKLKTHPMVDAQKEAAKIIEDASKEVVNALLQEGKEQVEEKIEDAKEDAEKQKETQEKLNGDQTKPKEAAAISPEQTDQLLLLDDIKRYAVEQNLTEEEIKGIVVDEQI